MNLVLDVDWLVEQDSVSNSHYDYRLEQKDSLFHINAKRALDVLIALVLGLILLPIALLTALFVHLDSHGPIFYNQERIGKNSRKFTIYKFRSMQVNADKILSKYLQNNPDAFSEWKQKQKLYADPRITRVGKWIRQFSIDEIPQLINVIKGDMSLVGPRPIIANEVRHYQNDFAIYCTVRPGITGLWQVSGRNNLAYDVRVLYDVYYVRNWSIWLDIRILIRTILVVLNRNGAY